MIGSASELKDLLDEEAEPPVAFDSEDALPQSRRLIPLARVWGRGNDPLRDNRVEAASLKTAALDSAFGRPLFQRERRSSSSTRSVPPPHQAREGERGASAPASSVRLQRCWAPRDSAEAVRAQRKRRCVGHQDWG
ncbi:hypothetical protein SAMN00790413_03007 [Deinococcus hopiensis KR-140]|uniref:Uncharacterized protein n=1 Tax=Deinococcus hopiensis KR-140 TaxID=695939 RepID=A0A1W1VR31_9DEIO|nr:hypothetical protein SAMN00790413_03007 [Deinococcus hopiensis KR-140]